MVDAARGSYIRPIGECECRTSRPVEIPPPKVGIVPSWPARRSWARKRIPTRDTSLMPRPWPTPTTCRSALGRASRRPGRGILPGHRRTRTRDRVVPFQPDSAARLNAAAIACCWAATPALISSVKLIICGSGRAFLVVGARSARTQFGACPGVPTDHAGWVAGGVNQTMRLIKICDQHLGGLFLAGD